METNTINVAIVVAVVIVVLSWLLGSRGNRHNFVTSEVMLHLSHPSNTTADDLVAAITTLLRPAGNSPRQMLVGVTRRPTANNWRNRLEPPTSSSRILTFPPLNNSKQTFSLVPVVLSGHRNQDLRSHDVISVLKDAYAELQNRSFPIGATQITLESLSPNWLATDLHHGGATGGPGSWPIEAHPPVGNEWMFQWQNPQPNLIPGSGPAKPKPKVHVAILDTAPTQHALDTAYTEWRWQANGLLERMWRPGARRPLNLYPAREDDFHTLHETLNFSVRRHRYWMRDHGLFVAGIINAIAPHAILHLFEVLSPFGLGTLETVSQGLLNVIQNPRIRRPLVINCSFMLNIPAKKALDRQFEVAPLLLRSVEEVFRWVTTQKDVQVIAAAGNDGSIFRLRRPATRYPAAFPNVYGVGAMPRRPLRFFGRYIAAAYSNRADDQNEHEGFMTLGGEGGRNRGVLGIYINDFPKLSWYWRIMDWLLGWSSPARVKYVRNTTGWAWWAGSSFAAPVITAIRATQLMARDGLLPLDPADPTPQPPYETLEGETVVFVRQPAD